MRRPRLVLMVKEPRPGRVKTRLAKGIGAISAAWWYRHQCAATIARLADPRWSLVLAVSPDRARCSRVWPMEVARVPQGSGDLGARMARLLDLGGPVVVLGSDIPGINRAHVARGLRGLGRRDSVIGPATDGGFWLIGWAGRRRFPRWAFDGVRWSGPHALADTLAGLGAERVAMADILCDVDVAEDLK